jgi:predicted N-acetyltransferase YhbS
MPSLALAQREHIDLVYRESHALWGVGMSRRDYRRLWDEVSSTPWARRHARFYVWLGSGGVLSSLKLYRPKIRLGGHVGRASVLGAIFTPRGRRRRGYAADLVRGVLDRARESGDALALLFSDIGTGYYEAFGFRTLPAEEHWGVLPSRGISAPTAWTLRPATEEDTDRIRRAHDDTGRHRAIAVVRDAEHWHFLSTRTQRYFERLRDPSIRQQVRVATEGGRFVGYVTTVEGRGEWNVREVGVLGGDVEDAAAMLRLGAAGARRAGLRRIYGWLPPELTARLPEWRLRTAARRRAVPMILPLRSGLELQRLVTPSDCYIPYHDQF